MAELSEFDKGTFFAARKQAAQETRAATIAARQERGDFPARCFARNAAPLPHRGAPDPEASSAGSIPCWAEIPPRRPPSAAPEPTPPRQH